VAASHIRVGTFEYFSARDDLEGLQLLTRHAIDRHYPHAAAAELPALALLEAVIERQAALIARWMLVGFIHGVMNTDNMAISGETIDYGPCAFLEAYDPATVFSAIDREGRYAFGNQPAIAHWNLMQLARALLPLFGDQRETAVERAQTALDRFPTRFAAHWLEGMRAKLGLSGAEDQDAALIDDWLALLQDQQADFTLAFRQLCGCAEDVGQDAGLAALCRDPAATAPWLQRWRARLAREDDRPAGRRAQRMRLHNPAIIARNHQVEHAIQAAVVAHDHGPFLRLLDALMHPWAPRPQDLEYRAAALPEQRVTRTFCGT
jgi:serine/tyrosine/threonine adenylyltransferase